MSDSLVSVIIPAYNRANLLAESLRSVNLQKYRPIQLIVVDDASDEPIRPSIDNVNWTGKIDVNVIRCPKNVGPGASRERGRLKSQGEYVSYLDSDDLWSPDKTHLQ